MTLLGLLLLAGCGQALQIPNTAPGQARTAVQASPRPTQTTPATAATAVPTGAVEEATPAAFPSTTLVPTIEPTAPPAGTALAPAPTSSVVIIPQTPTPLSNHDRWRAQQVDRQVLEGAQTFVARNPAPLLWFDPVTGQSLEIGTVLGDFTVQARFALRSTGQQALEVPYRINIDYGLTSISDAVRSRMQAAGYTESVEAYVIQTDDTVPK